ncbi:MAG: hypothetical protein QM796_16950 [Chthoniobacteraceae bacterium]
MAAPFYDRLIAVTYVATYPWKGAARKGAGAQLPVTLSEARALFGFDFTTTDEAHDANHDGIPDWWAHCYRIKDANAPALRGDGLTNLQAFQRRLNPNDFFNGKKPRLTIVKGNELSGSPGQFTPEALTVLVADPHGQPLYNAPVTFTVSSGGGTVQKKEKSESLSSLKVNADGEGQARTYFKLPVGAPKGKGFQITVVVGSGKTQEQVTFKETAGDDTGDDKSPFRPQNVVATLNPDGSADATWTNNPDAAPEPINLRFRDRNGNWKTAITVPAGSTSAHIPPQ